MVIIFDLDDTLYNEADFINSGFNAVSRHLKKQFDIPTKTTVRLLNKYLKKGRSYIIDNTLTELNIYTKKEVKNCIDIYRHHRPNIKIPIESKKLLKQLKPWPIYIISDGHKVVQKNKIIALGLEKMVKKYILTHLYGNKYEKPSAYCFELIRKWEETTPNKIVYIADDPNKDFIGIKKLGYRTIRIKQGRFKKLKLNKDFEADVTVKKINQINAKLLKKLIYE